MIPEYSLRSQLLLLFLLIGLIPLTLMGWISVHQAEHALMKESFAKLKAVQQIHKHRVENYFNSVIEDITILAHTPAAVNTVVKADHTYHSFVENGKKPGGAEWQTVMDSNFSQLLDKYTKTKGYYDLLLIDA